MKDLEFLIQEMEIHYQVNRKTVGFNRERFKRVLQFIKTLDRLLRKIQ